MPGYRKARDLQELAARGIHGYVALSREARSASGWSSWGPSTRRAQTQLDSPDGQATYAQRK